MPDHGLFFKKAAVTTLPCHDDPPGGLGKGHQDRRHFIVLPDITHWKLHPHNASQKDESEDLRNVLQEGSGTDAEVNLATKEPLTPVNKA
jgi:hypothetical protein